MTHDSTMDREQQRTPALSVIAACLNEEEALPLFLKELFGVLTEIEESFEVILVDDGSTDRTYKVIREWSTMHPECNGLQLSRNFGHQAALTAGLDIASGRAVITMDSDLQHPPSLIPAMVGRWREGAEVVTTHRQDAGRTPLLKRWTSSAFYRLLSTVSGIHMAPGTSDFRLLDRKVVEAFSNCRETHRMLRGLVQWVGFREETLSFQVGFRVAGRTKYTLARMMRFAFDGLFSFSTAPLRAAGVLGVGTSVLALIYLLYAVFAYLFRPEATVPGWTSILGAVLFMGGIQLFFLGILGEYVGRIFQQVKGRPLYLVRQTTRNHR